MSGYRFSYIDQNGLEFAINDQVNVFLRYGMTGFGSVKTEASTTRVPYTDGEELIGRIYTPARKMRIPLSVKGTTHAAVVSYLNTLRHNLSHHKNPETAATLKVVDPSGNERRIGAWLSEFSDVEWDGPVFGAFWLEFQSEAATFYDPVARSETLSVSGGGITFPITFPITFTSTAIDQTLSVNNSGDVEVWPTVRINGPGVNPEIANETTGKAMELSQALDAGDYIDIDMEAATISFYDASLGTTTNIIDLMSDESEFWALAMGDNAVHITMTSAVSGSVIFSYYVRYLGV